MTSAANLQAIRESKSLTQDTLAQMSGVSQQTISKIEKGHGNPTIETLGRLARALGVPVSDLLHEPSIAA